MKDELLTTNGELNEEIKLDVNLEEVEQEEEDWLTIAMSMGIVK